MSDLVQLYNPANASALTPEQTSGLQQLTSSELKELATAYPNVTMQRAYLLIIDGTKPVEKQLPALSSFENLYNLREKNGQRQYVAYQFKGNYRPALTPPSRVNNGRKKEVLDLSDTELMELPGFKIGSEIIPPEVVKVTKVKKQTKQ